MCADPYNTQRPSFSVELAFLGETLGMHYSWSLTERMFKQEERACFCNLVSSDTCKLFTHQTHKNLYIVKASTQIQGEPIVTQFVSSACSACSATSASTHALSYNVTAFITGTATHLSMQRNWKSASHTHCQRPPP